MNRPTLLTLLASLTCVACTSSTRPTVSAEPAAEPTGLGLASVAAPEQPSLPSNIEFGPGFAGPPLRVIALADGVSVDVVREGNGPTVAHGQRAKIRFEGFASNTGARVMGTDGDATTFLLADSPTPGLLHDSMTEVLTGMCVGERRRVRVPTLVAASQTPDGAELTGDVWITVELLAFDDPPRPAPLSAFTGPPIASEVRDGGLEVYDYVEGEGLAAELDDLVEVHYILTTVDGRELDSSHAHPNPFAVALGESTTIVGFANGLIGAKPGMLRKLVIPPELGYGDREIGAIPANSTLVFHLEIISVERVE